MDDGVGGSSDRGIGADGVLERVPGQDLVHRQILEHHLDDPPPRHMRQDLPARIDSWNRGIVRKPIPRASTIEAMVEAVPIVMQ